MDSAGQQSPDRPGMAATDLSVTVLDPLWLELDEGGKSLDVEGVLRRAVLAALAAGPLPAGLAARGCEVALVLTHDAGMRELNRTWRGMDKPTDVLSFPGDDGFVPPEEPLPLGDIVLARETMLRDAAALGRTLPHHLSHIAAHGLLHLLGWDHEAQVEAERMEAQERRILLQLGFTETSDDGGGTEAASDPAAARAERGE